MVVNTLICSNSKHSNIALLCRFLETLDSMEKQFHRPIYWIYFMKWLQFDAILCNILSLVVFSQYNGPFFYSWSNWFGLITLLMGAFSFWFWRKKLAKLEAQQEFCIQLRIDVNETLMQLMLKDGLPFD